MSFPDPLRSDSWIILPDDRAKHDTQFTQLKPVSGFITGEQARVFFLQSGLPTHILSKIWQLSDLNADGRMDRREFSIAMHLIKKTLLGFELPSVLPSSLLMDQPHSAAMGAPSMGVSPAVGVPGIGAFGASGISVPYGTAVSTVTGGYGNAGMIVSGNFATQPRSVVASAMPGEWCIPQGQRFKYKQLFNSTDVAHKGYLTGFEAKNILSQSGLIHSVLAQIWSLADIDTDGNLSPDEFCVAMYLIDMAKAGQPIPPVLPPDLVPPSYRRIRRPSETVSLPTTPAPLVTNIAGGASMIQPKLDSFGDLVPSFGLGGASAAPLAVQPDIAGAGSLDIDPLKVVTFEDRRKENFEKGQAELERRRAMLREQQQKETEERMAAERAELEKRERIRQEQEHKKQMELEKQLEKQRQLEMEREEQRKKAMEQREAARQELERQRQLEWERQRRDQLMSEKQRDQSQVDRLRLEVGQLKLELESFDGKKMELFSRMEQVRQNITEFTSAIDAMRLSRDTKSADIERFQAEFEEWNMKLVAAQQERLRLNRQVQTPDPGLDENFRAVVGNYNSKKSVVDQVNARLEKVEEEKNGISQQVNEAASQLSEVKNQLNSMMTEYSRLEAVLNDKKREWDLRKGSASALPAQTLKLDAFRLENGKTNNVESGSSVNWFTDFNKTSTTAASLDAWGMSSTVTKTTAAANGGGNDAWSFGNDLSAANKDSEGNSDTWANFDGADSFGTTSQLSGDAGQAAGVNWATDFFPSTNAKAETESMSAKTGFKKYTALYQFDARNPDELSLLPGDTVWVKLDQSKAEPEWMIGQKDAAEGCFPMSFVQLVSNTVFAEIPAKNSTKSVINNAWPQTDGSFANDVIYDTPLKGGDLPDSKGPPSGNSSSVVQPGGQLTASAKSSFIPVSSSVPPSIAPGLTQSKGISTGEGLQVQALYPWQAKKDNHLTFKKGDIITVLDQQDIWWSGQLNGKVGWFPKSYVKMTSGEPVLSGETLTSSTMKSNLMFPGVTVDSNTAQPPTPPNGAPTSSAFPGGEKPNQPQDVKVAGIRGSPGGLGSRNSPAPAPNPSNATEDTVVVATYAYTSNEPGDLTFNQGDVFTVQKTEGDWWTGTMNEKSGIFPSSYVRIMENLQTPAPPTLTPKVAAPVRPSSLPTARETPHKLAGTKKPEIASVIAPYQATGQEQLTLSPGQLIHVRKKSPSGWWEGELQARGMKRRIGWFPANYVKLLGQGSSVTTPDISNSPTADTLRTGDTPTSFPSPVNPPSTEQVVSLYNYQAQRDDELSFPKGSTINIISKDDSDWWKGEYKGKVGMFPSNYVTTSKDQVTVSCMTKLHFVVNFFLA